MVCPPPVRKGKRWNAPACRSAPPLLPTVVQGQRWNNRSICQNRRAPSVRRFRCFVRAWPPHSSCRELPLLRAALRRVAGPLVHKEPEEKMGRPTALGRVSPVRARLIRAAVRLPKRLPVRPSGQHPPPCAVTGVAFRPPPCPLRIRTRSEAAVLRRVDRPLVHKEPEVQMGKPHRFGQGFAGLRPVDPCGCPFAQAAVRLIRVAVRSPNRLPGSSARLSVRPSGRHPPPCAVTGVAFHSPPYPLRSCSAPPGRRAARSQRTRREDGVPHRFGQGFAGSRPVDPCGCPCAQSAVRLIRAAARLSKRLPGSSARLSVRPIGCPVHPCGCCSPKRAAIRPALLRARLSARSVPAQNPYPLRSCSAPPGQRAARSQRTRSADGAPRRIRTGPCCRQARSHRPR